MERGAVADTCASSAALEAAVSKHKSDRHTTEPSVDWSSTNYSPSSLFPLPGILAQHLDRHSTLVRRFPYLLSLDLAPCSLSCRG